MRKSHEERQISIIDKPCEVKKFLTLDCHQDAACTAREKGALSGEQQGDDNVETMIGISRAERLGARKRRKVSRKAARLSNLASKEAALVRLTCPMLVFALLCLSVM